MTLSTASYIAFLAPLVGTLLIALGGRSLAPRVSGLAACAAMLVSFGASIATLLAWNKLDHPEHGTLLRPFTWLTAGDFTVGFDLFIDPLSIWMMLVVTGVGFLIHVYSLGYMAGDPQFPRFFAYLNLFVFAMLTLVMAGNLVFLLIGWGLVGMASYLLIGFWHDRPSAVAAAKKAFVVNAIGDISIMLGLFLVFREVGVLAYPDVFAQIGDSVAADSGTAFMISILLLGGALAKSAQLPLHTWLPDAMEGPTPVSALIHAATMVTAGVYAVARLFPIFDLSTAAQQLIMLIGGLTLIVAGFTALAQTDIKRIIAYSTMSQIGYMFVAVGAGAYSAAMFHLATHAFFKALLFLGAGIVIHALADEQDIRVMGGLKKHMPKTYGLFIVASLALAGIFPLAGFFSKDEILAFTLASSEVYGGWSITVYALALVGALLTGIYSFRLVFLVFHGEESELVQRYGRGELTHHAHAADALSADHAQEHVAPAPTAPTTAPAHEAPMSMMWPVMVLGFLTIVGGVLVVPGVTNIAGDFLHAAEAAPNREAVEVALEESFGIGGQWALALLVSLPIAIIGVLIARMVWLTGKWSSLRTKFPRIEMLCQRAFGWDALYEVAISKPLRSTASGIATVERDVVVPLVAETSSSASRLGSLLGRAQSGYLRFYAFGTVAVVLIAVAAVLVVEG